MKTALHLLVLAFLVVAAPIPCSALREIATITKEEAKKAGIEVRAKPAGPDAVGLEVEFKPEGNLKEFTHVELSIRDDKSLVVFTTLRETRSKTGNVVVSLTVSRAHLEKTILSIVMHSPAEAGDHTYQLKMKDHVDPVKDK